MKSSQLLLFYWSQLWVKTLHFQCNTLVMRKNRVSSANLSNLPALRHGLAKEDFQSERKTPVLSVQGGLVFNILLFQNLILTITVPINKKSSGS